MTFADYCHFAIAAPVLQGEGVTVESASVPGRRGGRPHPGYWRSHPCWRLADLRARSIDGWRADVVYLLGHDQAPKAEDHHIACAQRSYLEWLNLQLDAAEEYR